MHGFRCHDNIHVCKPIALYTADAYSAEREMSVSAYTRSMARFDVIIIVIIVIIICLLVQQPTQILLNHTAVSRISRFTRH